MDSIIRVTGTGFAQKNVFKKKEEEKKRAVEVIQLLTMSFVQLAELKKKKNIVSNALFILYPSLILSPWKMISLDPP